MRDAPDEDVIGFGGDDFDRLAAGTGDYAARSASLFAAEFAPVELGVGGGGRRGGRGLRQDPQNHESLPRTCKLRLRVGLWFIRYIHACSAVVADERHYFREVCELRNGSALLGKRL
jgi:hypothetical protein